MRKKAKLDEHVRVRRPRSGRPKKTSKKGKGKGKFRSASSTKMSKEEMARILCTYFQQGNCRRDAKCFCKHEKAVTTTKQKARSKEKGKLKRVPFTELLRSYPKRIASRSLLLVNNSKLRMDHSHTTQAIQFRGQFLGQSSS